MQKGGKLRVYTDGQCRFCLWMQEKALRLDREQRLDWRDFNLPEVAAETPFSRDELARRMHVVTPDGQWHAGYFGWVAIVSVLPRWRWLAAIAHLWPFTRLGPKAYQFVANHRYHIPQFVLACLGAPAPCSPEGCPLPGTEVGTGEHRAA